MKNAEKWFLLLFIPLSLLMMIAMPIYRAPDEPAHLQRIYVIATGQMVSSMTDGVIHQPVDFFGPVIAETTNYQQLKEINFDLSNELVEIPNPTATAIYPPVSYLPQALGMWISMLFTNNRLVLFYSARVMNWLCTMIVLWWGIRKIPKGKWVFLFLTLLPINIQEMISASADGMATTIVFALTAFVLHARETKQVFTWRDYTVMALLSMGLVCWKVFYTPMVLLILMIPQECFGSKKRSTLAKAGNMVGAFFLVALWGIICYLGIFHGASEGIEGSTATMIQHFFQHPVDFVSRLGLTLIRYIPNYIAGVFGHKFSWNNVVPGHVYWIGSMVLCLAVFAADKTPGIHGRTRINMIAASLCCVLVVFMMLYVWWTPMDSEMILGFQGRYLLPLMLPVMLAVKPPKWHKEKLLPYLMGAVVLLDVGFLIRIVQQIAA